MKPVYIYPRSNGIFYVQLDDGKKIRQISLGTRNRAEAQKKVDALLAERTIIGTPLSAFVPLFAKMFTQLKRNTLERTYIPYAQHFVKVVGDKPPAAYTIDDVECYKQERLSTVTPMTAYMHMKTLQALFGRLQKKGFLTDNPFEKVERIAAQKKFHSILTTADVTLLCNSTNLMLRGTILLGYYAGMRLGEILRLSWAEVDFKRKLILILVTKTDVPRNVPMANIVEKYLRALPHRSSYVLCNRQGGPLSRSYVQHDFKDLVRKCQLEHADSIRFHDLRHSFATGLLERDVSIAKVQQLLGHESIVTTIGEYGHLVANNFHAEVNLLGE